MSMTLTGISHNQGWSHTPPFCHTAVGQGCPSDSPEAAHLAYTKPVLGQ